MRQLNGVYRRRFNRRHGLVGHSFQGRYQAILVQKDTYLLELTRLCRVESGSGEDGCRSAEWPWSSYRAVVGEAPTPRRLDTDWLLGQFGAERRPAIGAYRQFVLAGQGAPSPLNQVRHQMLLGDEAFVVLHQQSRGPDTLQEVSKAQRRSVALNLPVYRGRYPDRAEAMARAYFSGAYTMALDRCALRGSLNDGEPRCKSS